jgi:hypothetical protein
MKKKFISPLMIISAWIMFIFIFNPEMPGQCIIGLFKNWYLAKSSTSYLSQYSKEPCH